MIDIAKDWWFDGDYSECYYAWGHINKRAFAEWVWSEESPQGSQPNVKDVEHAWAVGKDDERFIIVKRKWGLLLPDGAKPITRYRP